MASGKKKKQKGKTLALDAFLQETSGAVPILPIRKTNTNWAEEVEDSIDFQPTRHKANIVLPTAPKAARSLDDYNDKIPNNPPYLAYLSNLPYDVDEDEIADFFSGLKIANMKIPKDDKGDAPKLKGFGYVEFEEREGLLRALAIPDCNLKGRRIRIEVATNSENDRRRGRMDMNRDRQDRSEVSGDWRSGPRSEFQESDRRMGGGGFNRDRDRDRDRNGTSDRASSGAWRDNTDRPSFRDQERGGFNRDREGGGFNRDRDGGGFNRDREGGGGFNRDREGGGGFNRDGGGGRFNRDRDRDFDRGSGRFDDRKEGGGFGPRRNDRDSRNGGGFRRDEPPSSGGGGGGGESDTRTRPKLNLKPRTKPIEEAAAPTETTEAAEAKPAEAKPATAASIFGNARPVDTSAREREIEERLAKDYPAKSADPELRSRRDVDRKRNDDDIKRSPRRESGGRKFSPRRQSPGRSPRRRSPRRESGSRSPPRSPPRRKWNSPPRRSPNRRTPSRSPTRRASPKRSPSRKSPLRRSPVRRGSPDRRSPVRRSPPRRSPPRSPTRDSPPRRGSPSRRGSPPRRGSPSRRTSPRRNSPQRKSPSRRNSPSKRSPDRRGPPRRAEDRKAPPKAEKLPPRDNKSKRDDKRDHEKEMPKLKEPEPLNFIGSNKYASLEADLSD